MISVRNSLATLLFLAATGGAGLQAQAPPTRRDTVYSLPELEVRASMTGLGRNRAANALDSALLVRMAANGTSALRTIERLPGVNVQSADAFGVYEWSTRVTIRGFQTTQIGQTLDGIPLGDMTYGNFNGLNIARAIDATNLAGTSVAQGSGALGTASANNLGGVIQYFSDDPANERGIRVRQLGGSYNALRSYLRFDLGLVPLAENKALRGYVSLSNTSNDKWKGGNVRLSSFPGNSPLLFGEDGLFRKAENWHDQFNSKLDLQLGNAKLTAFYDYSDKKEGDYMDLSLGVFENSQFGPLQDYWTSWETAKQYADLAAAGNPLGDVAYFASAIGARQDHFGYLRGDFNLGRARILITPYMQTDRGGGDWHAPSYGSSAFPDPIMFRQTQYKVDRMGITGLAGAEIGNNRIEGGFWFESNEVNLRRPRWRLVNYAQGPEVDFNNVLRLDFDRTGEIGTLLLYAQNTNRLLDGRLGLTYGIKYLHVEADFRSNGNTPTGGVTTPNAPDANRPAFSLTTDGGLLPQIGLVYSLNATEELFANYSENVNQYGYSPQSGAYNADPSTFNFLRDSTNAERASTFDLGLRTRRAGVEGSVAVYYVDYRNRIIGISRCPPTVTCASTLANVGSVTTLGSEALVSVPLTAAITWYASGALNHSTFDDDYFSSPGNASSRVATGGKRVQDAPLVLFNTALDYRKNALTAGVSLRHVGKRAFTYTNDLEDPDDERGFVPSYTLVDAGVGYRFGGRSFLKGAFIQLDLKNVLDERYVSTIGSNGFTAIGDNQTLLTGPRRSFFLTTGFDF